MKGLIDMKKLTALLLALGCTAALCGCYSTLPITEKDKPSPVVDETPAVEVTSEPSAQIPNPMREVNAEELCTESGLTFMTPIGAENVRCCVIDSEPAVYEMSFTLDGKDCCVRAAQTNALDESIAGVHEDWATVGDGATGTGDPVSWKLTANGQAGIYCCHTNGVTWSVYMSDGASEQQMCEVLRNFVPSL